MKKRSAVLAVTAVFVCILFLGAATAPNRPPEAKRLAIKGAVVQIGTATQSDPAAEATWRRVTGGASVVEVAETTVGGDEYKVIAVVTPEIPSPNRPCLQLTVGTRSRDQFRPAEAVTVNIKGIEELFALAEKLCPWRNGSDTIETFDIVLLCKGKDGQVIRQYGLKNCFATYFDPGDYSPDSGANLATLCVNVGRVDFSK